jgi:hypothetical protein
MLRLKAWRETLHGLADRKPCCNGDWLVLL